MSGGSCAATATGLGAARDAFAARCAGFVRADCDPVGGRLWQCSSNALGGDAPGGVPGPGTPAPDPAPVAGGGGNGGSGGGTVGRLERGDLLALHFDNCPDRDDGHAMAAGKAVLAANGLNDVVVVNGTCGDSVRNRYQPSSERVARIVYGDYLDAFGGGAGAVNAAADRWAATLANGRDVWVAEGGPSDFTARVLARIGSAFPSVDRGRIHVVQHSTGSGFNERETGDANLARVKRVTDYITVPNGNIGGNGSAGFNQKSAAFVATARASRYADEWNAAFAYFNPNIRLDFSDTVELLYIVGDGTTRTVDGFARRYLR